MQQITVEKITTDVHLSQAYSNSAKLLSFIKSGQNITKNNA